VHGVARSGVGCLFGEPEIDNLHAPVARDQDVVGLEVAMDESGGVRGRETIGDLQGEVEQPARVLRSTDGAALDVLEHQVVGPDVVQLSDAGVTESRDRAGFPFEALTQPLARHLDRDHAIEAGVARLPDVAHAPGANQRDQLVGSEPGAGRSRDHRRDSIRRPLVTMRSQSGVEEA
jgi:hypothetical protein